jgi:hypothetical protein
VVKQEQHRTTLAAVTQDNADFYEDEVAQLNASLEVADLETKIMVLKSSPPLGADSRRQGRCAQITAASISRE